MGKIVVTEFISLDGVVEDPGGAEAGAPADWTAFDRCVEGDQLKMAELEAADVQLLGRVTYQGYAAAWPSIQDEAGFAEKMNGMPKYVASRTLRDPTWNKTTVLSVDPVAEITALKGKVARDIPSEASQVCSSQRFALGMTVAGRTGNTACRSKAGSRAAMVASLPAILRSSRARGPSSCGPRRRPASPRA